MNVGIIGGGIMGLTTAFYLARSGIHVTVLEKKDECGGLSDAIELIPGLYWDRFYHVILPTDDHLLGLLNEIGLLPEVQFRETKTGFYTDGAIHSMSNIFEFLTFRPISLLNKVRLGIGILYASRLHHPRSLEKMYAHVWLTRVFGQVNYRKLWEPLLRSKLGTESSKASASFIWAYIHRLYAARNKGAKKELMGSVRGGYHAIVRRLRETVEGMGGKVLTNHAVKSLRNLANGQIEILTGVAEPLEYDAVISTVPSPQMIDMWPHISSEYRDRLQMVRYLKLICVVLILRQPLSPYYVMNITDRGFPFTGLIEASHVIRSNGLGQKGVMYLPRYMGQDDLFYERSDEEVLEVFAQGIKRIFPGFDDGDIVGQRVFREVYVQPVQELNYSERVPAMETPITNLFLLNTTMISDSSLNNNQVVRLAAEGAGQFLKQVAPDKPDSN